MNETPTFRASVEAQQLAAFLADKCKVNPGETDASLDYDRIYTYEELSLASGCDVRARWHILETARRTVQRECGRIFGTVRGVGIKLLRPAEIVDLGEHETSSILRRSRRTLKKLSHADASQLQDEECVRFHVAMSCLGAIEMVSKKPSRNKIEAACRTVSAKIDMHGIARLFGNGEVA